MVSPPEVPEPTVGPDLLQPLQVFSQLVVQTVGQNLKQEWFERSESLDGTSTMTSTLYICSVSPHLGVPPE